IPPSSMWRADRTRTLKRQLIFTFGNSKGKKKLQFGPNLDAVDRQIDEAVSQWQKQQLDSMQKHWAAWNQKEKLDTKLDMPLTPDRNQTPHGEIRTTPLKPNMDIPNIEISIEDIVE
ncbi:MAG: hypothetical protein R3Y19_07745, partial [Rikenellaceae bacterium]